MKNDFGMQYIMDGNGNYYTLNGSDQLVVAKDKDDAGVFSFVEANQRIGGGKKSKFYVTIPVDDFEGDEIEVHNVDGVKEKGNASSDPIFARVYNIMDRMSVSEIAEEKIETTSDLKPSSEYDIANTDWCEFVNHFIFISTEAKKYQEKFAKQHSDIEKEICDLLHYVELYDLTDEEGLKAMDMLKDARQKRRDIKDEISRTEYFLKMIGTNANVVKAKGFLTEMKKLDTRKYFPRQLEELFDGMSDRKVCVIMGRVQLSLNVALY